MPLDDELRLRYVTYFEGCSGAPLLRDPIEFRADVIQVFAAVEAEAKSMKEAGAFGRERGLSHRVREWMKQILKERYAIDWRSPQEMNPNVAID